MTINDPTKMTYKDRTRKYYKLTNYAENHNGFVYKYGLNEDTAPFNRTGSCCIGGLYFSDAKNIHEFYHSNPHWIREITIPDGEFDFVRDPSKDTIKWRSHSVMCGKRRALNKVSTWKWMIDEGITLPDDCLLDSYRRDNIHIVKYLLKTVKFKQDDYDIIIDEIENDDKIALLKYVFSIKHVKISKWSYINMGIMSFNCDYAHKRKCTVFMKKLPKSKII